MSKMKVIVCEFFYPEYHAAITEGRLENIQLTTFPPVCDHNKKASQIDEILSKDHGPDSLLVCSNFCHAQHRLPKNSSVKIVTKPSCFGHLISNDFINYLIAKGSYLVSSGWLRHWRSNLLSMGFDQSTARGFFQESTKEILFLDAGIDNQSEDLLKEFSAYVDVPYHSLFIGLDHLQGFLLKEYRLLEASNRMQQQNKTVDDYRKQIADYAAFFTIFRQISSYTDEAKPLEKIRELFVMVFGAGIFEFWKEEQAKSYEKFQGVLSHDEDYLFLREEGRFFIKVSWDQNIYGVLVAGDFLFPEYINHYLNLALNIGQLLGLVLHNQGQYEKLSLAKKEAESANYAKSRYLAHMNHEMRTPLNGFIGFLDLMSSTTLDEEQAEYMEEMQRASNHMLSIIHNVLDMAKIEKGAIFLAQKTFDLKNELLNAMAPLKSLAKENKLTLELVTKDPLPKEVVGDPLRLRQIILNLGGNAIKFTDKGSVAIYVECQKTEENQYLLQLIVEDTGIGMDKTTLDKLFEPFYQADDGTTKQSRGTGLGMAITLELIKLMQGQIHVDSIPGKGTTVEVKLLLGSML